MLTDRIYQTANLLKDAGIDNPSLDARLLVAAALQCERLDLLTQPDRILTKEEEIKIQDFVARRLNREPVSRILGLREFWGLPFGLNEATLDPRPDSETIIETVLRLYTIPSPTRILDLGTGTGCLLLALLHEYPQATGVGIDIAPRAVEQAKANAARLELGARATFMVNDWLDNFNDSFDVIVSNPPYIASAEISELMPEVKNFDPKAALDGGKDGLEPYRGLIPRLKGCLRPGGLAVFEVGQGQAEAVVDIFLQENFINLDFHKDLGGVKRCVSARRP